MNGIVSMLLAKIALFISIFSLIMNFALYIRLGKQEDKKEQKKLLNENEQKYWPPYLDLPKPNYK